MGNLGRLFDRVIHRHRRRRACRQLKNKQISSVLFLCHGNVYRSPYAAAALERALGARPSSTSMKVASAGFIAPGRRVPPEAVNAARARGIDLSRHVSALVTGSAVRDAEVVAVMSEDQARGIRSRFGPSVTVLVLGDLDPSSIQRRTITDPLGHDEQGIDEVYSRIDRCVNHFAALIAG